MDLPLSGVRVLDLTRLLPGAYCTLPLAGLGADVINVEEPGRGANLREVRPPALLAMLNRGKRSVALDLKRLDGLAALKRLAGSAAVLVESFRPGTRERRGVSQGPQVQARGLLAPNLGMAELRPARHLGAHTVEVLRKIGF